MGILDKVRKPKAEKPEGAATKQAAKKTVKKSTTNAAPEAKEAKVASVNAKGNSYASVTLKRPHVSEKSAHLAAMGSYVFEVPVNAEKIAIRKAVEGLYQVNVTGVRTQQYFGKPIQRGRKLSKRADWKKAIVTLKKGQSINLYEGV